jgi:branched-chain amino acid transport system ATP-binding protein
LAPATEVLLELRQISVRYGRVAVIHALSLTTNRGEVIAVLGPNGAGKTTLVRSIIGLVPPAEGEIRFEGETISRLRPHRVVARGIAVVPEGRGIFVKMRKPKLLLMDEPSLGLSPKLVDQTFAIVRALHREGTSILLIEQNARQALAVCDRGYILQKGAIVLSGSREELVSDERVQRAYFAADRNSPPTPA